MILGPRATFAGSMRSETSIRIDGAIEGGLIETPANVILTERARVTCEIIAKAVSIRGQFHGAIRADRVELLAGSQVSGVINANSFHMEEGVEMQAEVNLHSGPRPARPLPLLGAQAPQPSPPPIPPLVSFPPTRTRG